jgi:DNA invertase Pin-like site-specific DNA recombinase
MRVAIYARVSTTDQNCEMQLRDLRQYCKARKWGAATEYVDLGWSGAKKDRPQLTRLMQEARARRIDCVLVWKLDRWGRSVGQCLESIQELRGLGVRWVAVTQNLDTDESNPMSRLMLTIMAAFAEFEREMIKERVTAGLKRYREDYTNGKIGGRTGRHSRSGKDLPPCRPRRIFDRDRAVQMGREGCSIREIARALKVGRGTIERLLAERRKVSH